MNGKITNHGGSYVVEKGKTRKVEGTVEPEISAPRDAQGVRLDRQRPEKTSQGGNVAQNNGAALSAVHGVGEDNTGTKIKKKGINK